jgi:hypothetical protein
MTCAVIAFVIGVIATATLATDWIRTYRDEAIRSFFTRTTEVLIVSEHGELRWIEEDLRSKFLRDYTVSHSVLVFISAGMMVPFLVMRLNRYLRRRVERQLRLQGRCVQCGYHLDVGCLECPACGNPDVIAVVKAETPVVTDS